VSLAGVGEWQSVADNGSPKKRKARLLPNLVDFKKGPEFNDIAAVFETFELFIDALLRRAAELSSDSLSVGDFFGL